MPREKEAYRDNLERIAEKFPGQEMLSIAELSRWFRKDPRTIKKMFPAIKPGVGISIATLARYLS